MLEDILVEFKGTLIIVSHDRDFLDNVVTSTLVFEGNGIVTEHVGGYSDWRQEVERLSTPKRPTASTKAEPAPPVSKETPKKSGKMSNRDRKDLQDLPAKIAKLEEEQSDLTAQLADPELYKDGPTKAAELQKKIQAIEAEHGTALARWLELESRQG